MDVQIAVLCDAAADYNGKLCVMGSFDTIMARQFPVVHPFCSLALRIIFRDTDEGPHQMRVTLINEDGKSLLPKIEPKLDIRLPDEMFFATSNLVFNLQGLRFEKPGQYSIDVTLGEKMIARVPLQVLEIKAGPAPA
ncbi:MAG: hypothetical protein HZA89_04920 [Verrucomicrobia bacterium]|nr:hypothetical protein [Verrucomicrobiota bacterium]